MKPRPADKEPRRASARAETIAVERVQTGVRLEKRLLKVLKGLAEYHDLTLGDLLEGIVLHAFEGRSPFDADRNNWQPRVGFAYALNSKTSIRSGYGLFYTLSRATVFGRPGTGFTINSPAIWTLDSHATLNTQLNNPFPNGVLRPPGRSQGDDTLLGFGTGTIVRDNNRNPEYHSWNLSVQRELAGQSVLEVNYTGSRGTHLFMPITTLTAATVAMSAALILP